MVEPRRINLDEQALVGSLTTDIIADGAITAIKIGAGAVDSNAIAPGSIGASKFASSVFGEGLVYNSLTDAIDVNIDLSELQITADQLKIANGGIKAANIDIDANLSFNNHHALSFVLENVSTDPIPGNAGRLIWNTTDLQVKVDTGISFTTISGGSSLTIEDEGSALPQRAILNFVGAGVTAIDTGTSIQVSIPQSGHIIENHGTPLTQRAALNFLGSGVTVVDSGTETQITVSTGSVSYTRDSLTVSNIVTDHTITLSNTPVPNSEIVVWNGLVLKPGVSNDYTISGNVITLNAGVTLTIGDEISIVYAY